MRAVQALSPVARTRHRERVPILSGRRTARIAEGAVSIALARLLHGTGATAAQIRGSPGGRSLSFADIGVLLTARIRYWVQALATGHPQGRGQPTPFPD